jgi:hypothetical protein
MTREQLDQIDLRRFKLAQRNAMRAIKERDEAQQRLDLANADLMAWRTIVAARGLLPNNSSTNPYSDEPELEFDEPQQPEAETTAPSSISVSIGGSSRVTANLTASPNAVIEHGIATENKTRFVRDVIDRAGAVGKTPAEIRAEAIKAGVDVGPGYPYSVLGKLKKSGEIVLTTGGRYISRRATLTR